MTKAPDFHKQVDNLIFGIREKSKGYETYDEALAQVTALIQTLVPEEVIPITKDEFIARGKHYKAIYKVGQYEGYSDYISGMNACRDIILSAIKGVKADE